MKETLNFKKKKPNIEHSFYNFWGGGELKLFWAISFSFALIIISSWAWAWWRYSHQSEGWIKKHPRLQWVGVVTYNLQNLYDPIDLRRVQRQKRALLLEDGTFPDIMILTEVGGEKVLRAWLENIGYFHQTVIVTQGRDPRGIQVAIVSRFRQKGYAREFSVPWQKVYSQNIRGTRNILKVSLEINNITVDVYGVHLPSLMAPKIIREEAQDYLLQLVQSLSKDDYWILGGDFNIPKWEESFWKRLKDGIPGVLISHQIACSHCRGTYFHGGAWSFFDTLVFSPAFTRGRAKLIVDSVDVLFPSWSRNLDEIRLIRDILQRPVGVKRKQMKGTSDHFPFFAAFWLLDYY